MDINCEDWRTRDVMWNQTRHALQFFHKYLPFWKMAPADELTAAPDDYCFARPGEVYAVYLPSGGTTSLDLGNSSATFTIQWFNPRRGEGILPLSPATITGPGPAAIGQPPRDTDKDWVALIKRK
jgi:hypothetical protein